MNRRFLKVQRTDTRGILKIALLSWIILSVLGAVPYYLSGVTDSFASALLESFSGFTTTGVTVFENPQYLPKSLLVYRSFTSWIGGAGVLVFLASMLKSFDADEGTKKQDGSYQLYRNGIRFGRIASRLLFTYILMSVVAIAVLFLSGEDSLTAFIYACASVSTGGFTNAASSLCSASLSGQNIVLLFMLLSCVNYTVYYHLIKKHFKKIGDSTELFAYIFIVAGSALLVVASLKFSGTLDMRDSVRYGIFQTVSYASTTGINICDTTGWPTFTRFLLSILSFTGGCTASVGSGIKILRIVILTKTITRSFITRIHPQAVVAINVNNKRVSESSVANAFTYLITYAFLYAAALFIISFECSDFETPFIVTSALLNNLGGIYVGAYSAVMKVFMCIVMLAGRLELYALFLPFIGGKQAE